MITFAAFFYENLIQMHQFKHVRFKELVVGVQALGALAKKCNAVDASTAINISRTDRFINNVENFFTFFLQKSKNLLHTHHQQPRPPSSVF